MQITVTIPTGAAIPFVKQPSREIHIDADEIHISTHGVLVLKRYGNIIQVFAHGEWLKARK